jgi:hypothetical protein
MMMPQAMELDDVTNFFYKHTNLNSKLKEIGRSQLAEELQETWRLSSLECEQQNLIIHMTSFQNLLCSSLFISQTCF